MGGPVRDRGARTTAADDVKVQYVWDLPRTGPDFGRYIDAPVLRWRDTGGDPDLDETLYFCQDANMNVTALVDGTTGSGTFGDVVERVQYDPYGKPKFYDGSWQNESDGSAYANEILFCGYRYGTETGLYDVRYRYCHPTLGRWVSRDPITYYDGMSLYQYVRSRPAGAADPWGLWGRDFHEFMTGMLAVNAGMCFPTEVGEWANAPDTGWRAAGAEGVAEMDALRQVPLFGGALATAKWRAMQEWHFPMAPGADQVQPGGPYAAQKYKDGIDRCNLKDFAEGLHTFQDSWAHQGKPTVAGIGHGRKRKGTGRPAGVSTDADDVNFWPEDARAAAEATFDAMLEFMKECPCIEQGPHRYRKSRCGDAMEGGVGKWLESQFPGENVPGEGGYQLPVSQRPVRTLGRAQGEGAPGPHSDGEWIRGRQRGDVGGSPLPEGWRSGVQMRIP